MAIVNDKELVRQLKSEEYARAYYFYGKDILTVSQYSKRIADKMISKDNAEFNLHSFEGKSLDLNELDDAVNSLPVFSDRKCILINDLNAEELTASDLNYLIDIISNIPDGVTVIVYNTGINIIPEGKKTPTAKNKKIIDTIAKIGTVCDFAYGLLRS